MHIIQRHSRGPESRVGPTREACEASLNQSPYAKHMRLGRQRRPVVHSETRVTSYDPSSNTTRDISFYFVACCYRTINSSPRTLCGHSRQRNYKPRKENRKLCEMKINCAPVVRTIFSPLSMTLVFCVLFTRIEEEERGEERRERSRTRRGARFLPDSR